MWIFTTNGFLSIVRHDKKKGILIVRSRFRGHIDTIFPSAIVQENTGTDYEYRSELPAREVSKVIAKMVREIDYGNFKNSLEDSEYRYCCLDVYETVASYSGGFHYRKRHPQDLG